MLKENWRCKAHPKRSIVISLLFNQPTHDENSGQEVAQVSGLEKFDGEGNRRDKFKV